MLQDIHIFGDTSTQVEIFLLIAELSRRQALHLCCIEHLKGFGMTFLKFLRRINHAHILDGGTYELELALEVGAYRITIHLFCEHLVGVIVPGLFENNLIIYLSLQVLNPIIDVVRHEIGHPLRKALFRHFSRQLIDASLHLSYQLLCEVCLFLHLKPGVIIDKSTLRLDKL